MNKRKFYIKCLLCVTLVLIFVYLYENFKILRISGNSMYPTFQTNDMILVKKVREGELLSVERGAIVVLSHPYKNWDKWDKINPVMNRFYVKRAIGIPGDTIFIKDGKYCINSLNIFFGDEQIQKYLFENKGTILSIDTILPYAPINNNYKWSIFNMDKILIPYKGMKVHINSDNYNYYKRIIEWETGYTTKYIANKLLLDNNVISTYVFKHDYYFFGGDNVLESIDSRFWGIIPESMITGRAIISMLNINTFPYIKFKQLKN